MKTINFIGGVVWSIISVWYIFYDAQLYKFTIGVALVTTAIFMFLSSYDN